MRCSKCGSENREGRKFCANCGAALAVTCRKCGVSNQPGEKFCGDCGAALGDAPPAPAAEGAIASSTNGERRHLTVLFCDLVGSMEIAARLDPEEWREIVAAYHRGAAEAITRFGGYVAQYLGDGVMAYFGWPQAHENDAERAARAGLAILEAVSLTNQQSTNPKIAVRVGIDSGGVVVGIGAGKDADVFGETPNIAARVQAAAAPNTVLITDATHRLLSGLFVVEKREAQELKGIANPIELYRVLRPSGVRGRLATARGLTPFVGRQEELGFMLGRWERTREGEGQLVLVVGEAGIGKSRMVAEFHDHIRGTPHIWMESAGEQLFENTPFHAITEMLSQWLELQAGKSTAEDVERLERALTSAGLKSEEAAPMIADLLQLPVGERYSAIVLTPEQKRRQLLAALTGWVLGAAKLQPVVMVVEDLHWLDPSTLELLELLGEQSAKVRLLLLCTARPEFHPPWPLRSHHTQITLNRLSVSNVHEMIALVAARNALASESVNAVIERTGGVPLFVEELTRAVLESGGAKLGTSSIPVTLHDSLMARLDRLGSAKEILQIGSVIGGEFSYELMRTVHSIDEEDLQRELRRLTDAELLYVRGIPPQAMYTFKHVLIQDAAYEALLKKRRRELHRHVGSALSDKFPELAEAQPELLAHHYTAAGMSLQAVPYWQRAGQRTLERSANVEAIRHLTKGLEVLQLLPSTPERAQQELTLQITLGSALVVNRGHAAPEVEKAYTRARELCQQLGETPQLFPVLWGLWDFYLVRAELQTGHELGEQLLTLAQRAQDPALLLEAHDALGQTLWALGEFASARAQLEQGMALYDPQQHGSLAFLYGGEDPGVICFCYAARVLWYLGYPDQALGRINEALTLAQELSHPYSLAVALWQAAALHQHRREGQAAQERAEAAIKLSTEQGFPHILAYGTSLRGWALAGQGQEEDGIAQVRWGAAAWQDTGAEIGRTNFLALLAEAYGKAGQAEKGLAALADAPAMVDKTRDRRYEAELYRLKGELLLAQESDSQKAEIETDSQGEAEACFLKAIEIAQKQQAKSWELRATLSLARLLRDTGHRDEPRTMLAKIYNWFTEGFDTADLKEAKALLDELSC